MRRANEQSRADLIREVERVQGKLDQSLQLTQSILDSVPGGVVHVSVAGEILAANPEGARLLGFSYDELTGRYTQDWEPETIHEDGTPCPVTDYPVTQALMTGEAQPPMTIGVRRPDSGWVWAVFTALPLKDHDAKVTGAVVTFLDITERKSTEDARLASEAKLRSIVDSIPDVVMTTDRKGKILFVNRAVEGISSEQVVGTSFFDYVDHEDRGRLRTYLRRVVERGETVQYEQRGLDDEAPSWWAARLGPVEKDGNIVGVTAVLTDRTDAKRADEERERLRLQLAEVHRLEAVGQLAGGVAHDFNNLLTVIQGGMSLLGHRLEGTSHAGAVEQVSDAAERAARLTRQLLAFGRMQTLEPQSLCLNDVVLGLRDMLARLIRESIELRVDVAADVWPVRADPVQLERVLLNLAANARDAMPDGGALVIRTFNTRLEQPRAGAPSGAYVALEVTDTGVGMVDETRTHVFEPFFTTKELGEGTGLGLATAHGIITQSGGYIEVESAVDEGSTFRVLLPRDEEAEPIPGGHPPVPSPSQTVEARVLLVEDDTRVRDVVKGMLEAAGFQVFAAAGSRDALARFEDRVGEIDLLLCDVVMPFMSGPKLAEALLARKASLRMVFMSGHAESSISVPGATPANVHFLAKPFSSAVLVERLSRILSDDGE